MGVAIGTVAMFAAGRADTARVTNFASRAAPILQAATIIAISLPACQTILHPAKAHGGVAEKYLMWTLAALAAALGRFVLFVGGKA